MSMMILRKDNQLASMPEQASLSRLILVWVLLYFCHLDSFGKHSKTVFHRSNYIMHAKMTIQVILTLPNPESRFGFEHTGN